LKDLLKQMFNVKLNNQRFLPFGFSARKGRDPDFDFKRMAFVQEASGKLTEDLVVAAQSNVQNARRSSLQAAWNLFTTSLENDQVIHDKHLAAAEVNSHRARSVLVASLEDWGIKPLDPLLEFS